MWWLIQPEGKEMRRGAATFSFDKSRPRPVVAAGLHTKFNFNREFFPDWCRERREIFPKEGCKIFRIKNQNLLPRHTYTWGFMLFYFQRREGFFFREKDLGQHSEFCRAWLGSRLVYTHSSSPPFSIVVSGNLKKSNSLSWYFSRSTILRGRPSSYLLFGIERILKEKKKTNTVRHLSS